MNDLILIESVSARNEKLIDLSQDASWNQGMDNLSITSDVKNWQMLIGQ